MTCRPGEKLPGYPEDAPGRKTGYPAGINNLSTCPARILGNKKIQGYQKGKECSGGHQDY